MKTINKYMSDLGRACETEKEAKAWDAYDVEAEKVRVAHQKLIPPAWEEYLRVVMPLAEKQEAALKELREKYLPPPNPMPFRE